MTRDHVTVTCRENGQGTLGASFKFRSGTSWDLRTCCAMSKWSEWIYAKQQAQ